MTARQFTLPLVHRPALGRADFLVSSSNAQAVAWIDRWPDWPGAALVIYGPKSCGKTHLLHVWRERAGAVFFDPCTDDVEKTGGDVRAVCVDDAQCVAGNGAAETALFHLYNMMAERRGHILLAAAMPPAQWGIGTADLASRLKAASAAGMEPPDDALLAAVLVKQFSDRQVEVGSEALDFLLPRMERTFEAAASWVERLDRLSLSKKKKITPALVREALGAS